MTSAVLDKFGMLASVATIVAIFAVMFTAPAYGLAATAAMLVVNGIIMVGVMRGA